MGKVPTTKRDLAGGTTPLSKLDCHRDLKPQAAPIVVHGDDLALDGLSGGIAISLEKVAVETPFQGHRVLGEDDVPVLVVEGNPLTVNFDLGAGDAEQDALVLALVERDCLSSGDGRRKGLRDEVFLDEPGVVDELQRLVLAFEADVICQDPTLLPVPRWYVSFPNLQAERSSSNPSAVSFISGEPPVMARK